MTPDGVVAKIPIRQGRGNHIIVTIFGSLVRDRKVSAEVSTCVRVRFIIFTRVLKYHMHFLICSCYCDVIATG
jgi:hypothetical protein